jgi:hypothetical protein
MRQAKAAQPGSSAAKQDPGAAHSVASSGGLINPAEVTVQPGAGRHGKTLAGSLAAPAARSPSMDVRVARQEGTGAATEV